MASAQELFNKACKSYNDVIDLIKNADELVKSITKADYDTRATLAEFDRILQGILITEACVDGNFDRLEMQFIEKITDYGDILQYISKETDGELSLTWDNLRNLETDTQLKFAAIVPSMLEKTCDSFITPLALLDKALEEHDMLKVITDCIAQIGAYLSQIDGKYDEAEAKGAALMVNNLLANKWLEIRDK